MVAGMEVDKVANKVAYMAPENRINCSISKPSV